MQVLGRLTCEQRDGALDKTKANYVDRGLLRMVDDPQRAALVEAMLETQGAP